MAQISKRDLALDRGPVIPAGELRWDFGPSSGPGGQHANRSRTRAGLTFSILRSTALNDHEKDRISRCLQARIRSGAIRVVVDDHRSQWRNRQVARGRLRALLDDALKPPPPTRKPIRPSRAARRRRIEAKRRRSRTKQLRRPPERLGDG